MMLRLWYKGSILITRARKSPQGTVVLSSLPCKIWRECLSLVLLSTKTWQDPFPVQTGLPSTNDETLVFARCMTELAHILKQTSDEIYHIGSTNSRQDKSETALKLDKKLVRWKEDISPVFDMENTSLTERESLTKRKIVLKLRKSRSVMLDIHIDRSRLL